MSLFSDEEMRPEVRRPKRNGGSSNPIVFNDYESFIAKFADNPKTTDDCYTPKDVYEAVVKWVGMHYDLTNKKILRPFYPGGDYVMAEYPEDGVVIDNPPFSIFTRIVAFYTVRKIPFFLFGPGLTIGSVFKYCTAICIADQIRFENGAIVRCNFASNLFGDLIAWASPSLEKMIRSCPSQNQKVNLVKYRYPKNLLAVSELQTIANGKYEFKVRNKEACIAKNLDNMPNGKSLFSEHLLLSPNKAAAKAAAKAAGKAGAKAAIPVELSPKEQWKVKNLKNYDEVEEYPMPEGAEEDEEEIL